MLRQEINLYSSFKTSAPTLKYLSWKQLILSTTGFLLLLILSYLLSMGDYYYQKYRQSAVGDNISLLQAKVEKKKSLYPAFFFSDNVAKEVEAQEKNMQIEAQLLEKIANHISFSTAMLALGEIDLPNIWASEIDIKNGGDNIEITGYALSMPDLKSYFTQIENNHFFKNDHVSINKVEHTPKEDYPDFQTFILGIAKTSNEKPNL